MKLGVPDTEAVVSSTACDVTSGGGLCGSHFVIMATVNPVIKVPDVNFLRIDRIGFIAHLPLEEG